MKFTYCSGQRPLDGFTIKRGIGKGGFGEVYFALSDGGKEVALKVLRSDHADVELRGIRQCLNLKHPNLVALYDVKVDDHGQPWVVMEYIAGETLNALLNRNPRGLPLELIHQWFPSLCRAVNYLHEHGIVHRDLKPANIFIEQGILKIGDYGLSKSISSSHRQAQTCSVGTVHYMAPEISSGNYDKSVDVYALGVLFYEMLTGHPPFDGESAQEIMMKHLMALPDLTKVPPAFQGVLAKALAKDPKERHATAAEMVTEVERLFADIGMAPLAIPMKAVPILTAEPVNSQKPPVAERVGDSPLVPRLPRLRRNEAVVETIPIANAMTPVVGPMPLRVRLTEVATSLLLSGVLAAMASVLLAALNLSEDFTALGTMFFLTVGVCWSVLIPAAFWTNQPGDDWGRRFVLMSFGVLVGLGAFWLDGWSPELQSPSASSTLGYWLSNPIAVAAGFVSYFSLGLGLPRWWRMAARNRRSWFSFGPVVTTMVWAFVLLIVYPWRDRPYGVAALILGSMIVQWVSPWSPPPPTPPRRLRLRRVAPTAEYTAVPAR
jgi:serine/threonine protein kinase